MRNVSQGVEVRDGRVEESERSEGDDVGLRVLVGRRQAVVSTNDISGDGVAKLAERAVAMARVAPDDKYVGLADPSLLKSFKEFPDNVTLQILSTFPTFILQQIQNAIAVRQIVPRGVDRTDLHWTLLGFAEDTPEQRLILYTPVDEHDTPAKLAELLAREPDQVPLALAG